MKRSPTAGLSQLELMISLIIMGMLAVLLANALNFNRQSLDRVRYLSDNTETLLIRHKLRQWVEDMPMNYGDGTALNLFEGGHDSMRFLAIVKDGHNGLDSRVAFVVRSQTLGTQHSLVVQATASRATRGEGHQAEQVLATSVANLSIHYFGRISSEREPRWHDSWADDRYLPVLVKIEWETDGASPVPPLTLQPGKTSRQREMSLSSLVPPG